jgi:hypothetical protein
MSTLPAGAPAKVCILCGADCSKRPRVKDAQGRYSCKECLERHTQTAPPPADDLIPSDLLAIEASAAPAAGLQVCPNCQSSMPHGAPICIQCGFDSRKNAIINTNQSVEKARPGGRGKCPECGYSLKGLKHNKCPECGTLVLRQTERDKARYDSDRIARMAYIKPLLHFGVGILIVAFFYLAQNEGEALMFYALKYAIQVPIGVVAFFLCCLLWMGFDAPMHLTALRLAGVYALVDAASLILSLLPLHFLGWVIVLAIYIGLLAEALELDLQDAIIVGVVTSLIRVLVALGIFAHLQSQQ